MTNYDFQFFSNENLLQSWVANYGPATTNVDVSIEWLFYKGNWKISDNLVNILENVNV